ncbi:DUF2917 domain-containing protein [Ramlibacter sp. G-1-2-2]|uniref:DUF2917 domain-containing protein n=1 Tax=Ramlibacter agri TaxID=2728837 RepID=A0A848HFB2_9BURK|nr:DUF2917 domain-containing protein [Ramlibacter agri]NML48160.1 DUF2917 domain-containing protein [Ramlibacter agri]
MDSLTRQFAHRTVFSIPDASAVQVRCTAGTLWLTLDHDPRDVILTAGESFVTTEHRRALLYALEPAAFTLASLQRGPGVVPLAAPAAA